MPTKFHITYYITGESLRRILDDIVKIEPSDANISVINSIYDEIVEVLSTK